MKARFFSDTVFLHLFLISAIYYFFTEYHWHRFHEKPAYDDLLYYFALHYHIIQLAYKSSNTVFKNKPDYVQLDDTRPVQDPRRKRRRKKAIQEQKDRKAADKAGVEYVAKDLDDLPAKKPKRKKMKHAF